MLVCILPLMAADAAKSNVWGNVLLIFSPLLVAVVSKLTAKVFKKLDIDIEDSVLEGIFAELFRLIASAEKKKASLSAEERFRQVVDTAYAKLSKKNIVLLEKRFGSVENAVQAAFEQSSVSRKISK
jgi:hypothetical protein